MASVLSQQMAKGQAPAAAPAQTEQAPMSQEGELQIEQPTPEEQAAFDKVEAAATATIHQNKEIFKKLTQMLQAGKDSPEETLARAALLVFGIVDEKSGGQIPETVIMRGAEVCLDLVIKLAEDTGIMEVDDEMALQALRHMVVLAGKQYGFDTTPIEQAMAARSGGGKEAEEAPEEAEQVAQEV